MLYVPISVDLICYQIDLFLKSFPIPMVHFDVQVVWLALPSFHPFLSVHAIDKQHRLPESMMSFPFLSCTQKLFVLLSHLLLMFLFRHNPVFFICQIDLILASEVPVCFQFDLWQTGFEMVNWLFQLIFLPNLTHKSCSRSLPILLDYVLVSAVHLLQVQLLIS